MLNVKTAAIATVLALGVGIVLLTLGVLIGFFTLAIFAGGLLGLAVLAPVLFGTTYLRLRLDA